MSGIVRYRDEKLMEMAEAQHQLAVAREKLRRLNRIRHSLSGNRIRSRVANVRAELRRLRKILKLQNGDIRVNPRHDPDRESASAHVDVITRMQNRNRDLHEIVMEIYKEIAAVRKKRDERIREVKRAAMEEIESLNARCKEITDRMERNNRILSWERDRYRGEHIERHLQKAGVTTEETQDIEEMERQAAEAETLSSLYRATRSALVECARSYRDEIEDSQVRLRRVGGGINDYERSHLLKKFPERRSMLIEPKDVELPRDLASDVDSVIRLASRWEQSS